MQHHKLDFRNKSPLEQIVMGENLVVAAAVLPEEQRQTVRLDELRTVATAARASHERIIVLRAELKSEISSRKMLLGKVRTAATSTALGLTLTTNNDPAAMQAAGLELAARNTVRLHTPDAPVNLRAVPTDNEGEAQLRWRRTVRRCTFDVQWHADPPDADRWQPEDSCTKAKCVVKGLVSGGKYWFRIRATTTQPSAKPALPVEMNPLSRCRQ